MESVCLSFGFNCSMSDVASGSHEHNTCTIVVLVYDNKCRKIRGESRVSVGDKIHHNVLIIKNEIHF
jgi:hypothetical protein